MKRFCLLLAAAAAWCVLIHGAANGQPILKRVEDLLRNQLDGAAAPDAERGYFGLLGDDTADRSGVQVLEVYPDQPAARGGIEANDVITSLGGTQIRSMDDMLAVLEGKPVGARLKVEVLRAGQPRLLDVTLGRRPDANAREPLPGDTPAVPPQVPHETPRPKLGVRTVPVTPQIQAQNKLPSASGALVISVATGSAAEQAGIPLGAIVTEVNDITIRTPQDLSNTVQVIGPGEFTLAYVHNGQTHRTKVQLAAAPAETTPPATGSARPPQPALVVPAEAPAAAPPATRTGSDRLEELERRIEQLEARIKSLESKQSEP